MAMNKELLTAAVGLIEDASFLNTSSTYYRRGTRGDLHARACYLRDYDFNSVVLTVAEAGRSRVCRSCFVPSTPSPHLLNAALDLAAIQAQVAKLPSRPADEDVPRVCEAAEHLERKLNEEKFSKHFPALESGERRIGQALADLLKRYQRRLPKLRGLAVHRAAADVLHWDTYPRGKMPLSPLMAQAMDRLGDIDGISFRAGELAVATALYRVWKDCREDPALSRRKARTAVFEEWKTSGQLATLSQLTGVHVVSDGGQPALDVIKDAWSKQAIADIEGLLVEWEEAFARNLEDTLPVVIGYNLKLGRYNGPAMERVAYLKAFPQASGNLTVVAECPAVVAYWVHRASVDSSWVVESAASQSVLDTAAVLWDPYSKSSPYVSLEHALIAARELDHP